MGRLRHIDRSEIFDLGEIAQVVDYCRRRRRRLEVHRALAVFRLATCCGLREQEIARLTLGMLHVHIDRPYIDLPGGICKYGRSRKVPLTWDTETRVDIESWYEVRVKQLTGSDAPTAEQRKKALDAPYIVRLRSGQPWALPAASARGEVRRYFVTAVKRSLGAKRADSVTTHTGRHTFASWAATRVDLVTLKEVLGHADLSTTSIYAHVVARGEIEPTLFTPATDVPEITTPAGAEVRCLDCKRVRPKRSAPGQAWYCYPSERGDRCPECGLREMERRDRAQQADIDAARFRAGVPTKPARKAARKPARATPAKRPARRPAASKKRQKRS